MYLKNITILGFKSFADKTTLNFLPGVTAIVGPNGCGKSNVSDAIRWVLGEQSAKALRGGEMADVIFNGTDGRKPLGMAEVSLTIGDVDQEHLTAAGVEIDFNEVTVTRRVFRDGASEYFINKAPCRLKDIQQLFMGTGVGRTSYSIMAQGNITQILSSRPEDRRLIFEEAAGITKFKAQKREALRKLEHTDQNLVRVEDLIREVKRQIGSLQRQAGKARRYKQLSQELQHLDTQLARHQFDVIQAEIHERRGAAEQCRAEIESHSQNVLRSEEELRQLREHLSELEHQISGAQQRSMELKNQTERQQHTIQVNQERLRELDDQNARALADIAQSEERRLAAEQELAAVVQRLSASQAALEDKRRLLAEKHQALAQLETQLRDSQQALRSAQTDAFQAAQLSARVRNEINALDLQKQGNVARLEKLSSEKIQLEEERSRLESRVREFATSVEEEKQNAQSKRGTVEERQQRLREIQQQLNHISQELDGLVRQQAEHKSRLNVLEQLDTSHEGFGAGALAALQQSQWALGSLADKLRVPDPYVAAVEAALGHHLQVILTQQPESARHILSDLSAQKKGRASIASLALGTASPTPPPPPALPGPHGVPALGVIEAEAAIQPLLQGLLGRTLIVSDLSAATEAWVQGQGGWDFVTQTGELLDRHGIFTGGTSNGSGKAPASILGRKNQILELQTQLGHLQQQIGEISRQKGALQSEHTALTAGLQQAQTELRAQEVAIATHEGECNALQTSLRALHQKIDTVVFEIQNLSAQDQEGTLKRQGLASQLAQTETQEQSASERVNQVTAALEALRHQRDEAQAVLTESKVAVASEEQLCAAFGHQQAPLETRIAELTELIETRRTEMSAYGQRRAQFESEMAESSSRIERLEHEREQEGRHIAGLQAQRDAQEQDILAREHQLRALREQLTGLQQKRGDLEIELAQKTMAAQNLRDRVQQKYQVNLDDVRSECITITYADEGPARVRTLSPEEMKAAGVATDWEAVSQQVTALQSRLDEMGPVNLVAIDEYEETEQRHQFLTTQHDDLVKAKAQLLEVINRINAQTKEMFIQTFHRIRENFLGMFTEIFGGGKADLKLVDEGDVLESGIDIMARPPGKQLQSISLLSGGEQTMTAVALLFSIYQVKPSPFCVLDELDAPLDESNINRFIRILKRFIEHSQFIVITHNKRTIGMADILYGVTMQEHGVSRIVSVKFHKAGQEVTDHRPASLETPVPDHDLEDEEDKLQAKEETLEVAMAK